VEEQVNGSSELRPAKTEETTSHHQNINVKEVGTSSVPSNLCTSLTAVSTAVQSKVTKTIRIATVEELTCCWLKCCFTSTETVGLLGAGAQDVHLDFHTPPEL